ncbi:hypothetical protein QBZ16_001207 [Prototheca wickerhamii]|uniref:Uncharacterized protein n=1 Tax=Prototheca wickerhamii TaxID=3111 RepID=A0AAD9MJB2_PROWI|nr:hypothetical protein QBZ16_001207 [Prototheca wickerhamii]
MVAAIGPAERARTGGAGAPLAPDRDWERIVSSRDDRAASLELEGARAHATVAGEAPLQEEKFGLAGINGFVPDDDPTIEEDSGPVDDSVADTPRDELEKGSVAAGSIATHMDSPHSDMATQSTQGCPPLAALRDLDADTWPVTSKATQEPPTVPLHAKENLLSPASSASAVSLSSTSPSGPDGEARANWPLTPREAPLSAPSPPPLTQMLQDCLCGRLPSAQLAQLARLIERGAVRGSAQRSAPLARRAAPARLGPDPSGQPPSLPGRCHTASGLRAAMRPLEGAEAAEQPALVYFGVIDFLQAGAGAWAVVTCFVGVGAW